MDLVDLIFSNISTSNIYTTYKSAVRERNNITGESLSISYEDLIVNINLLIENDLSFEDFLSSSTENHQVINIFSHSCANLDDTLNLLSSLPSCKSTRYV